MLLYFACLDVKSIYQLDNIKICFDGLTDLFGKIGDYYGSMTKITYFCFGQGKDGDFYTEEEKKEMEEQRN